MSAPGFEVGVFGARGTYEDVTEHIDLAVVSGSDGDREEPLDEEDRRWLTSL